MISLADDPVSLVSMGAPHVIATDTQLREYTDKLFSLTGLDNPSEEQIETINLLSLLVETYEKERFPIRSANPLEVLAYLIEANGLEPRDLESELGSETEVAQVFAGERPLTLTSVQKLSKRFRVSITAFVSSADDL